MADGRHDFFVSYTGVDKARATWVAGQLEAAGYRTPVQALDFGSGNFIARMDDAVRTSDGREHLVAAFLYRYHRDGKRDGNLGDQLINLLTETGDQADADFAAQIKQWLGGAGTEPDD